MSAATQRMPPHNLEAEREVLSCALLDNALLAHLSTLPLTAAHFYSDANARLYATMQELFRSGQPVDTITLRERLVSSNKLQSVGGDDYLLGLTNTIPTTANVEAHARIVRDKSIERAVIADLRRALASAAEGRVDDALDIGAHAGSNVIALRPTLRIDSIGVPRIFEALPPTPWKVRELGIAPGRPALVAAYGASAKTLSLQSLGLSVAAGMPVWGRFAVAAGRVLHIDYEQGERATRRRYQRLAAGAGIEPSRLGDRLHLAALPRVFLNSSGASDIFARTCEGFDIVIVDALRGAVPGLDENDSRVREPLDVLTHVSERVGCAFVVIHHAGKPKEGHTDARTVARGSSAIFDACGSVLVIAAGKTGADPKRVSQVKTPADGEGAPIDDFTLAVEDVEIAGDPTAGVRVVHRPIETADPQAAVDAALERDAERVLEAVRQDPESTQSVIRERVRLNNGRVGALLETLHKAGKIAPMPRAAKGGGKVWRCT